MVTLIRRGTGINIVDLGRHGKKHIGIPSSGAMDVISMMRANSLLGNDLNHAVIELYMPGHVFQFQEKTTIALSGADTSITLNDRPVATNMTIAVSKNDILQIGKMNRGARLYLAFKNGINTERIVDSASPFPGQVQVFKKGHVFEINGATGQRINSAIIPFKMDPLKVLSCHIGPEWHYLSKNAQEQILAHSYTISPQSNRMGYRLEGKIIGESISPILSSGVLPGTIQLLPSGLPLILMRDCQTTGGYPRILQVGEIDINQLAQRKPGEKVRLSLIS